MKKAIWMAGGMAVVSAVFFIPEQAGGMWPSVMLSSTAALLYLIVFSVVWLKEIWSPVKRKIIGGTLIILVVFSAVSASISYVNSSRQSNLLPVIRTTIETNLAGMYINEPLLKTLEAYHVSSDKNNTSSIRAHFFSKYDSLITEDNAFNYGLSSGKRTLSLYLAEAKPDRIVLIGESGYVKGMDPDFQNHSGEKGRYQVEGILTPQGVRYERTN